MDNFSRRAVWVSVVLVVVTGCIYGWMKYFAMSNDPYAIVNHPWQPAMQHAHVLTAPLFVFAVGLIWRDHIWCHFRSGQPLKRRSGIVSMLTLVPMALSGYLLQISTEDAVRMLWIWTHGITSLIFVAAFALHMLMRFRRV